MQTVRPKSPLPMVFSHDENFERHKVLAHKDIMQHFANTKSYHKIESLDDANFHSLSVMALEGYFAYRMNGNSLDNIQKLYTRVRAYPEKNPEARLEAIQTIVDEAINAKIGSLFSVDESKQRLKGYSLLQPIFGNYPEHSEQFNDLACLPHVPPPIASDIVRSDDFFLLKRASIEQGVQEDSAKVVREFAVRTKLFGHEYDRTEFTALMQETLDFYLKYQCRLKTSKEMEARRREEPLVKKYGPEFGNRFVRIAQAIVDKNIHEAATKWLGNQGNAL